MHPVNAGACSVVDIAKFDPLDFNLKPNAQRYEEGSPNGLGMVGLNAALSLIEEVGVDAIAAQVMSTTRHAMDTLRRKGYTVDSPNDDDRRAGILMFSHARHASDDLLQVLRQANVFASLRNGRVRFSPHFYNTAADLDAAIDALPK
jgi:cysteine desulfurase/selenocysteine lyase